MMTESPTPASSSGWTRGRIVFLSVSGLLVLGVLLWTREVLLPFLLAVITAYVLTPAVAACEKVRVPRGLAIVLVYAVTIGALYGSISAVAPRIAAEGQSFVREVPSMIRRIISQWGPAVERDARRMLEQVGDRTPEPLASEPAFQVVKEPDGAVSVRIGAGIDIEQQGPKLWRVRPIRHRADGFTIAGLVSEGISETASYVRRNALEIVRLGQLVVTKVARAIFLTFMTLMVAAYLMYTREIIFGFFRSLVPARARLSFDRLIFRIDRGFSGVVRGQLVIMVVNGILSAIGFWLFKLKYWPILALVAGFMSIVPIFGSILSSIPIVMVALAQNFKTALLVLVWIILIHQIEANVLNPKIIGAAAKLHPVLVIFSLLVGEHQYGIWGALLAVPAMSLAQSLFNHFRFEALPDAPPDSVVLTAARRRAGAP